MKKILLSILFCLFAIPAFATQYYINYGVGNDTNNGTATGTPFNTCTPIEGTNFLKPGDIVSIFYTNDFINTDAHCNIASAGSASSHITFNTYGGTPVATGLTITTTVSSGAITGGSIAVAGTGYTAGQIVNVMNSTTSTYGKNAWTGGQFTVSTVSGGVPQTITLLNGGYNYTATTGATTSAPQPVFDQSVNITSAAGWTGWSFYEGKYTIPISSSTVTANCVYTDTNSNSFTVTTTINPGTTLTVTGTTAAPASTGTLTYSSGAGTCTSPLTYSSVTKVAQIYNSQTTIPFAVANVNIDSSYSLRRMNNGSPYNQTIATMLSEVNSYYQSASAQAIYISLSDFSSPASHTVGVGGEYFNTAGVPVVGADGRYSSYIDFYNMTAQGGFNYGFLSLAPYVTFNNILSQFNGREGIYFGASGATNGIGAAFDQCNTCTSQYNNGYFTGSAGQGITIESPHVDLINSISQYNWMAGIDLLKYPASGGALQTNPIDDRIINTFEHNNSMRAWNSDPGGYDPACIYTDGTSNVQVVNNVCLIDGVLGSTTTANAIGGINLGNERPTTYSNLSNFDVINSLFVGGNYNQLEVSPINCTAQFLTINITVSGGGITGGTINNPGSNYAVGQIVSVAGGTGGQFTVTSVNAGVPQSIILLSPGSGYTATTGAGTTALQPNLACYVMNNVRIVGSTFINGLSSFSFNGGIQQPSGNVYMYNNIFSKNAGSTFGIAPGFSAGSQIFNIYANNNTYYNPGTGSSQIFNTTYGSGSVSFSAWQSAPYSQDSNGQYANPTFTTGTAPGNIPNGYFLSSLSSGQGSNSPALAFAIPNYLGNQYTFSSIGTVLTNQTVDSSTAPASGYHYYSILSSSSFPSSQVGSDIGGSVY